MTEMGDEVIFIAGCSKWPVWFAINIIFDITIPRNGRFAAWKHHAMRGQRDGTGWIDVHILMTVMPKCSCGM